MTSPTYSLRLATPADTAGCLAIYRPIVEQSSTSFEVEAPTEQEFGARIHAGTRTWPWLVAVDSENHVAGYAYASKHRERSAYQWCVEVSAYVDPALHRSGLGRRLYEKLFACLRAQGFQNAYAGVALPNDASLAFHRSMGFGEVGVYEDIGFKLGAWQSVNWLHKRLCETSAGDPQSPRALSSCCAEIETLLQDG
jgi:phosphinothricin acetyltransferase